MVVCASTLTLAAIRYFPAIAGLSKLSCSDFPLIYYQFSTAFRVFWRSDSGLCKMSRMKQRKEYQWVGKKQASTEKNRLNVDLKKGLVKVLA